MTAFGIFDACDFAFFFSALRNNGVASILAEPNLVAMNGHEARFQAGGEFPVSVPTSLTEVPAVEFKDFGVIVNFVPTILDDETIRLRVSPEVSNIDQIIAIAGLGTSAPVLSTRNVQTTVELKQGQTLALAGLLQVELDANTNRVPGLGDVPYLGPFFSNTTHQRIEKELLVMVTPYLVSPMEACQGPPMPGSEILDPNDCEFYFLNRIEGRTGYPYRSPTSWDDPCGYRYLINLEEHEFCGPVGYSE
jgi:pilus assembly protein CpaC